MIHAVAPRTGGIDGAHPHEVPDGLRLDDRVPKVAADQLPDPVQILNGRRQIEAEPLGVPGDQLRIGDALGPKHQLDGISGDRSQDAEDEDGSAHNHQDRGPEAS